MFSGLASNSIIIYGEVVTSMLKAAPRISFCRVARNPTPYVPNSAGSNSGSAVIYELS
jgi:hypothetical protein